MMTENTEVRELLRRSKCSTAFYLAIFVFGLFSLVTSAVLVLIIFAFMFQPCKKQTNCHRSWGKTCGGVAIILFLIGVFTLLFIRKRRQHRSSFQVVFSEIPAEDVEKTPAFIPSYNCIPHHQLFDEASSRDFPDYFSIVQNSSEVEASSINSLTEQNSEVETSSNGLPDYFSVVQNLDQVYSDADLQICTHNVPETSPPCYEDVMETMAATLKDVGANFEHRGNTRDI